MQLETERLLLREFTERDWQATLAYQADEAYLQYYPWHERTELDVRSFIRMFIDWSHEIPRRRFQLAIIHKEEQRLIGNCGIRKAQVNAHNAEIGYELASTCWGQGYATEAAQALLRFGFTELQLHRIHAHCIEENVASARVLEKIGMSYEGCMRESEWMKGRWWNTKHYAILEQDWRALS